MGRIKGTIVKRVTNEIMEKYRSQLSHDFEANKKFLRNQDLQKKTRNSIAGFIARKVKREEKKAKK